MLQPSNSPAVTTSPRSANASLLGYHYQFDKSIIELLALAPIETITLEGIEDIDVNTPMPTSIQCKYLAAQRYVPSLLREPLQAMLVQHKTGAAPRKYTLYAHFNTNAPTTPLTIDGLKNILTYTHKGVQHLFHVDENLTDKHLITFLQQFTLEQGPTFEDQHQTMLNAIAQAFAGTQLEAREFHYPRVLTFTITIASKPTRAERTITRKDLTDTAHSRDALFTLWHHALLGTARTIAYHKILLKRTRALDPTKQRLLIITNATINRSPGYTLVALIKTLTASSYQLGRALYTARPWTIAITLDSTDMDKLKRELLKDSVAYNDGHEALGFYPAFFNKNPIINRVTTSNSRATNYIGAASYTVRLINTTTLHAHAASIATDVLFTTDNMPPPAGSAQHTIILGDQYSLADIAGILT